MSNYLTQLTTIGTAADADVASLVAQLSAANATVLTYAAQIKTLTAQVIALTTPTPVSPPVVVAPVSPSGVTMPVSEPNGWTRIYGVDDWTGAAMVDHFAAYPPTWSETSKHGMYSGYANTTVSPSLLTIKLLTDAAGIHRVTALQPNKGKGQLYGRYSVRARFNATDRGYKTAWLLWPDDGVWPGHGEIDWPEGNIPGNPSAFAHWASPTGGQDAFSQPLTGTNWHTYTTEWSPGKIVFLLDDAVVGTSTKLVPATPMHWVLQCETEIGSTAVIPAAATVATIEVDWITMATKA